MSRSGHFRRRRRGPRADATGWYGGVTWFGPAAADNPAIRRFEIGDGDPTHRRSRALVAEIRSAGGVPEIRIMLYRPSIPRRAFGLLERWLAQSQPATHMATRADSMEISPSGGRRRLVVPGLPGQRGEAVTVTLDTGRWPDWAVSLSPRRATMEAQQWAAVTDWLRAATAYAAEIRLRERAAHYG